ncbi:MAG: four helix bundle protein [Candidatus Cloacimonetes bacterium]|nr:four helix bundle protein [Candidatus Cloacimonadota bacterium]
MAKLEDLEIFQDGLSLVKAVYSITNKFPEKEKFNLTLHLNKTAVQVVSNICESYGRKTQKDKAHFLDIAYSSLIEAIGQLYIAKTLGYISEKKLSDAKTFVERYKSKILKFKHNLK